MMKMNLMEEKKNKNAVVIVVVFKVIFREVYGLSLKVSPLALS
jgi:hypothetical protein